MQASKTKKNNGRRARGTGEKFENALKRRQDWRGTKRTRNGRAWHVYLALLAVLATRTPLSLCVLTPSRGHRLFFWFFPVTSPPLPLPCPSLASKVTLGILEKFGYLISYREIRQLSPSFFLFLRLSERSCYSLHISLVSSSLVPRGAVHFSRNDRSFELFIYIVRPEITSGEKICRVQSSREIHTINAITRYASDSECIFRVCNPPLSQ